MKRPFAVIGFTVFLTIAFLFDKETGVTAAALAVFAVALVVALFSKKLRKAKIMPLFSASGVLACVLLVATNTFVLEPVVSYAGAEYRIKAQIKSEVDISYGNYYYEATTVTVGGEKVETDLRLVFDTPPDIKPYDYVEGDFAVYQPGLTDEVYLNANRAKGLYLGAYPISDDYVITEIPDAEKPFAFRLIGIRNIIKRAIYDVYPDENGALAVAMILGDKSEISSETHNSFRSSGIVHLICVSGLHLTLWSSLILGILRGIGFKEKFACVLAAAGTVFFMAITGFSYSVLRAGIMMLVYLASRFASRDPDSINSLGFSVAVIALVSPYAMASASLQLSVLATAGIICANEFFMPEVRRICGKISYKTLRTAVETLAQALLLTLSATIFIQPVMLGISGGFNFAAIISNLIITPFASGAMILSVLSALAGSFLPPDFNVFYWPAKVFLQYIIKVSGFMASKEFLGFSVDETASAVILCIMFFFVSAMVLVACVYKPKPLAMFLSSCTVFFACIIIFASVQKNETKIRVVDTGNGVSVLVTQGTENVLVGCGGTSFIGASDVINAQNRAGGIDGIVIPSANKASSAYAVNVIKECVPKYIYCDALPENVSLLASEDKLRPLEGVYSSGGIELRFCTVDGKTVTFVKTKNMSLLVCASSLSDLSLLPQDFKTANLLVCLGDYPDGLAGYPCEYAVVCAENSEGVAVQNELIYQGVNAVATGGCGDVVIKASKGNFRIDRD